MAGQSQTLDISADELVRRLLSLDASAKLSLLDSCGRSLGGSKFLIAGIYPAKSLEFYCQTPADARAALQFFEEQFEFYKSRRNLAAPFGGGVCIATLTYEFGLLLEELPPRRKEFASPVEEPSATFSFYETIFIHDYDRRETVAAGRDAEKFAKLVMNCRPPTAVESITAMPISFRALVSSNFTESAYLAAVEQIRKHIALGNIYQANLTQQLRVRLPENLTPEQIFRRLRGSHPAPFAAFIRRDVDCVVSASPERFFQVQSPNSTDQSRTVTAAPIKGTRRRGALVEEDLRLRRELELSAKDRAENVMIVDLLRNDLGRVCKFGSVRAEKLFEIEEHETLFHLVSTIRGELRNEVTFSDLLRATFPCGSITGAPKIRAMQILDNLETVRRGLSMGAIGYFAFDDSADLSVAIRTMTINRQTAVFNVGGGIVFDSQPEAEYQESWLKAKALISALRGE